MKHEEVNDNREPIFRLLELTDWNSHVSGKESSLFVKDFTLLYIQSGRGKLNMEGQTVPLRRGMAILLLPAMVVELRAESEPPLLCYRMTFQVLREKEEATDRITFEKVEDRSLFPYTSVLPKQKSPELGAALQRLYGCLEKPKAKQRYPYHGLFHDVLTILLSEEEIDSQTDAAKAISQTIAYMQEHHQQELSREALASIAGMSPWYYSHQFKEVTGQSPGSMLREIRIRMAKKLLLHQDCPVGEVAHRVGYRDESYFRSVFKEQVGMSPTMFVTRKREKIAAMSYHYAAHLLTLNVVPYATYVEQSRESHRRQFHELIACHLRRASQLSNHDWEYNLQELARVKPEVILCDELLEESARLLLEKVAPVVVIPWLEMDWRDHFGEIASFLGKRREADRWMSAYESKAEKIRKRLMGRMGNERVGIFQVRNGKLLMYGMRNGGSVLYKDLQLSPVSGVNGISVYQTLGIEELPHCDCDRMILVVDKDAASRQMWEQIRNSREWTSLQAVQAGQVHLVSEIPWLEYSPYTHTMVLDAVEHLF